MPDYAISAVSRTSGDDHLIASGQSQESRRFQEIGTKTESPWDKIDNPGDQVRIIQEAAPSDGQLKTAMPPWDDVSSRLVNRIDGVQRDWDRAEKYLFSFSFDKSDNMDLTSREGMNAIRSDFRDMLKVQYHMVDSQVRVTLMSSIGTTIKNSISALYRQQG